MSSVITDADYKLMERQRKLRNGERIEYTPSAQELRLAEARKMILAFEIAEYVKRHKPSADVLSTKELAQQLGISEKAVEALTAEERLQASNHVEHSRIFGASEETTEISHEPEPIDYLKAFGMTEQRFEQLPVEKRLQLANDYAAREEAKARRTARTADGN